MPTSLFQYEMLPTTWFYLSALMIIATFFKFSRFWSIRNLDLIGLIFFTPGLLFLAMGDAYHGYVWLHVIGFLVFCRLLADPFMVRRPLLEPNLAVSGLIFGLVMLVMFLVPNLMINRGEAIGSNRTLRLEQILSITEPTEDLDAPKRIEPGYRPFQRLSDRIDRIFIPPEKIQKEFRSLLPSEPIGEDRRVLPPELGPFVNMSLTREDQEILILHSQDDAQKIAFAEGRQGMKYASLAEATAQETVGDAVGGAAQADSILTQVPAEATPAALADVQELNRLLAEEEERQNTAGSYMLDDIFLIVLVILTQFGIVFGLIVVGHCHFGNFKSGVATAMVFLLLPYVNQMTGSLDHFLPGMLLVLAAAIYRRPIFSGFLIGLAGALVFYPFFLLPLWFSFYWKRGVHRFTIGVVSAVLLMGILLLFSPTADASYAEQLSEMFGYHAFRVTEPTGIWAFVPTYYRIPMIALFLAVSFGLAIWPSRKNFATLLSCSALLMLGVQFWIGRDGGLFMGWYLPLLILTIFRPNLEDRVATSAVIEV